MLMRKGTVTLTFLAAAALAAVACQDKKDDVRETPLTGQSSSPTEKRVTNTGATIPTIPAAAAPVDPLASAVNKDAVGRFADEEKLTPTQARVAASQMTLRDAPLGTTLGMVKAGDSVTQIARERGYVLILTTDPRHTDKQMAAWVYKDAFITPIATRANPDIAKTEATSKTATSATGEKFLKCAKGETSMRSDREFCAKECRADNDCKTGACDGAAILIKTDGNDREGRYCVTDAILVAPASAPTPPPM